MYGEVNATDATQTVTFIGPACKACQIPGMICDQPGITWETVYPQSGWMPMLSTTPETLEMVECINEACVGGAQKCQTGYTGILCTGLCVCLFVCVCSF